MKAEGSLPSLQEFTLQIIFKIILSRYQAVALSNNLISPIKFRVEAAATVPKKGRGSSVSIVSDYGLDGCGSIPDRGRGLFLYPLHPDRL
jgi:hypothetical protein